MRRAMNVHSECVFTRRRSEQEHGRKGSSRQEWGQVGFGGEGSQDFGGITRPSHKSLDQGSERRLALQGSEQTQSSVGPLRAASPGPVSFGVGAMTRSSGSGGALTRSNELRGVVMARSSGSGGALTRSSELRGVALRRRGRGGKRGAG
eukprot:6609501-Prymnesium_polylepis.1